MRVLLDTCVVIDVLQRREPFWNDSYAVLMAIANRHADGFVTAESLTDIYDLTHRLTHDDRQTRRIISSLLITVELLDTAGIDCRRALSSNLSDYEDAVMSETALRSGMDCIVTRNLRDYRDASVPVYTPQEFLREIELSDE